MRVLMCLCVLCVCRTFEKKMERFYKCHVKRKDPDGVSALPPKPYKFRFQQKMARIFGLTAHARTNAPAFHRSHPALLDVLDHSDFPTQRQGTFVDTEPRQTNPGARYSSEQDVRLA